MSFSSLSNFEGPDTFAFIACVGAGFIAGSSLSQSPSTSLYITVLVSYHLFLVWLVFFSGTNFSFVDDATNKTGIALPFLQTLLTHAACLAIILSPVATAVHRLDQIHAAQSGTGSHPDGYVVYQVVKAICGAMGGLAIFERRWLFSAEHSAHHASPAPSPSDTMPAATADDVREWHAYLAQRRPGTPPAGASLKAEYEQWLQARHSARGGEAPAISNPARP